MGLSDFMHTKAWKIFMGYIYGIGAAIVILGALFKLMHWPGGSEMLIIGMSAEALIFFLSVFEPLQEQPDWGKVYPQLKEGFIENDFEDIYTPKAVSGDAKPKHSFTAGDAVSALMDKTGISEEMLGNLKSGLQELSNTAGSLTSATTATSKYVENLNAATDAISDFTKMNSKASESVDSSINALTNSYSKASDAISESANFAESLANSGNTINSQLKDSGDKLNDSFEKFTEMISGDLNSLESNSKSYHKGLEKLNNSLSSLNATYELQLEDTNRQSETISSVHADYIKMNGLIKKSMENTELYGRQAEQLNINLKALNQVYDNVAENLANTGNIVNSQLKDTGDKLGESFKKFAELISGDLNSLESNSKSYNEGLEKLNNSLASLNATYELQLEATNQQSATISSVNSDYTKMTELITKSMEITELYGRQAEQLNNNLKALNQVYGNMLGALNLNS